MISWLEKNPVFSWLIVILIASGIFYVSSLTSEQAPRTVSIMPTVYHISAFFFLAFFLSVSLTKGKNKKLIPIAITLAVLYGIIDELHQFFVPGRTTSITDIFLDSLGILIASTLYLSVLDFRNGKNGK
ncbi:VanZ family protein [Candidatus Pacearchaeota archaeon]|nr:VanZ family protein [Candidatus Pacearchaeota archaeon]